MEPSSSAAFAKRCRPTAARGGNGITDIREVAVKRNGFAGALLAFALVCTSPVLAAEEFPTKPIKMIVPYAAGGGTDIVARIVAQKLQEKWGPAVIVENRSGAGGNLGAEDVFTAPPDGYTLLFTAQGPLVVNQSLYDKLAYDPAKFTPVSLVVIAYNALLAYPEVPATDVRQLIDYAKAHPDKLNYASQGVGTAAHLTAELFKSMAGIKIDHIPYRGSGPAVSDLVAGHVDLMFGELAPSLPYIQSGQLRALAVSSDKRLAVLPDIPTVSEVLPGFVVTSWWAIVAPPGTPEAITDKLSAGIGEVVREPDVAKKLTDLSMIPKGSTPDELAAFIKDEAERWGNVVRASGAKAQ
jgi:tripartite-type tricarboxylate transporter receptor subunit TctC